MQMHHHSFVQFTNTSRLSIDYPMVRKCTICNQTEILHAGLNDWFLLTVDDYGMSQVEKDAWKAKYGVLEKKV